MREILQLLDKNIFFFFQSLQRPWLDYALAWPTYLGSVLMLWALLSASILIFDRRGLQKLPAITAGILGAHKIAEILKAFFGRPRPHVRWPGISVIFPKPLNDAFPSGHAAVIFAGAFALNYFYGKKMRWTYGLAVWIALTRLYVGVHYPTDLFGGALTGVACAFLACRYLKLPLSRRNSPETGTI